MKLNWMIQSLYIKLIAFVVVSTLIFFSIASFEKTSYHNDIHIINSKNHTLVLSDSFATLQSCFSFSERNYFVSINFYQDEKLTFSILTDTVQFLITETQSEFSFLLQNRFISIPPPLFT
ncbi:MAG: hypothetical protein L6Q54_01230 [Leptospiraceae bacterium]|nr:hypothetical protein [Leptospiraceae bacterium]MCK6379862.1 hypothetical protein [Leptospiraceae bacterium]NUM42436.1 hypothetical protein [Leptospiraceae bacterium]